MFPPESTLGTRMVPPADRFNVGTVLPSRVAGESYFERLLEFLDWVYYSEEGMVLSNWGLEGVTYEVVDGKKQLLPHIEHWRNPDGDTSLLSYGVRMFYLNEEPEWVAYKSPEGMTEFLKQVADRGYIAPLQPALALDPATQEFVKITQAPLNDYVNTAQLQFIYGELDIDDDWDGYLRNLESRGYKELEERVNEAMR
jgi:putative aldouronate transport system substrate-binding protein